MAQEQTIKYMYASRVYIYIDLTSNYINDENYNKRLVRRGEQFDFFLLLLSHALNYNA